MHRAAAIFLSFNIMILKFIMFFYYFNHCTAIKSKDNENIINIIILIVFLHFTQSVDHARICP